MPSDVLTTLGSLDREEIEIYRMSLNCIIESSEQSNKIELVQIGGSLHVLDEDDNVPVSDYEESRHFMVRISLSDHGYDMSPVSCRLKSIMYLFIFITFPFANDDLLIHEEKAHIWHGPLGFTLQ